MEKTTEKKVQIAGGVVAIGALISLFFIKNEKVLKVLPIIGVAGIACVFGPIFKSKF